MPDDVIAAAPAAPEAPAPVAPVEPAPAAPAPTPVESATPATDPAASAAEAAPKAANEFAPSLLDAAAQPQSAPAPQEGTPAGDKPADAKPDAPGETPPAPITYEFKYPDGFDPSGVNSERMSAYTGILGDAKVAPEIGQKLLDLHLNELGHVTESIAQRQWDVFNETQNKWRSEVMSDPELGGQNHQGAIRTIMSLVDQYGGNAQERKDLLDAFRITGAANNPAVLRFMHRAGKALSREAEPHPAPPPRSVTADPRQRRMNSRYGSTTPPG